jgi:hypothetical protein
VQLLHAQTTYIPPNGNVHIYSTDTVAIFGDMINDGNIVAPKGAVVNFYGLKWRNNETATIKDESNDGYSGEGGLFRFIQPNPVDGNILYQLVKGGYSAALGTGCSFPNIRIESGPGIVLDDLSDLKVVNTLDLLDGHVFLNGWNLVLGHHTPGNILHYSNQHFIVTGGTFGSGYLYRSAIAVGSGQVIFPIGTQPDRYTPLAINNSGQTTTIKAGVSDGVLSGLTTGDSLISESINKTWEVGSSNLGANIKLTLAHLLREEGPLFAANRTTSYIARFNNGAWDVTSEQGVPVSPNTITTGPPLAESGLNTRQVGELGTASNYFTKLVADKIRTPDKTRLDYFEAFRTSEDTVLLKWITGRENNCAGFTIERRFPANTNFDSIGFVPSIAPGGYSTSPLGYEYKDPERSDGLIFYRLKVQMKDGTFFYSQIRVVRGTRVRGDVVIWPNPLRGHTLHIYYGSSVHIKAISLIDVLGRRLLSETFTQPLQTRNYYEINVPDLTKGVYFLQFIDESGNVAHAEKVIVIQN